jgi:drug/metabolite transporter (DMT)-like permease
MPGLAATIGPVRRVASAEAALLLTVIIWSVNFSAVKIGLSDISPLAFSIVRFVMAATVTVAIVRWREGPLRFARKDWPLLLGAAVSGITFNQVVFVNALNETTAVNVALLTGTIALWTAIIAVAVGQERLDARHWIGVLAGLGGVVLIIVGGGQAGAVGGGSVVGDAYALLVAISWAVYSVLIRPLMTRYSALQISAFVMTVGTAILVPFAIPDLLAQDWSHIGTPAIAGLLYATFPSVVLTNILYFTAIHRVGAARASLYIYLEPFLGVLFAVWLLAEGVSITQLVGGLIVVGSILVARPRQPAIAEPGV